MKRLFDLLVIFCLISPIVAECQKIDSLLFLLKNDRADSSKAVHLNNLSAEYQLISHYDSAAHAGEISLKLSRQLNFKRGIADACNNLGNVFFSKGEYSKTLEYYFEALKIDIELNDKKKMANRLNNIGNVYYMQSNHPEALDYYFKALKISEETKDLNGIASRLGNIGNVYFIGGDYPKALEYYFKQLKINEKLKNKNNVATTLANIGAIYFSQKEYLKSLEFNSKSLKLAKETKNKKMQASTLGNIGSVHLEQGRNKEATDYYEQALKLGEELGDKNRIATMHADMGSLYTLTSEYKKSFDHLYRSLALFDRIGQPNDIKNVYLYLSTLYEKSDTPLLDSTGGTLLDTEKMRLRSMYYYKRSVAIKDEIFSEENKKQLIQKEMDFEFQKKMDAAKAEQDKKDAMLLAERNRKNQLIYLLSGISIIIFLISLVTVLLLRQNKLKATRKILETEQKLLRLQMNPHFIFNSLSIVQGHINKGKQQEAGVYLLKISKLLRAILENSREEYVSFEKEILWLENYLSINQVLMENQFEYRIEVDEAIDKELISIPPMIVQPFIENALKYGVQGQTQKSLILIRFKQHGRSILCEVEDNYLGTDKAKIEKAEQHKSLAIQITRERLANLYGISANKIKINMNKVTGPTGIDLGMKVDIEIPTKHS